MPEATAAASAAPLDTLYTVETPEGVSLSMRPAGVVARCQAWLIDFGIRLGMWVAVMAVAGMLGGVGSALASISFFLIEWFYPVVFELGVHGATPGKRSLGLRVVMDSGLPVTAAASVIRNLLRAADFLPMLYGAGLLTMLLRRDGRRLGDLAAGTLVVYRDTVQLHGALPPALPLAPARGLDGREQVAIVAWAGRAGSLTPARFEELAELAQGITGRPAGSVAETAPRLLGVAHWLLGRRPEGRP